MSLPGDSGWVTGYSDVTRLGKSCRPTAPNKEINSTASISGMACWQQLTENAGGDARLSSCESKNLFQPVPR
jgi:hypothetical protein